MNWQERRSPHTGAQDRTPKRPLGCLTPTLLERLRDNEPGRRTEVDHASPDQASPDQASPANSCMVSRSRMREIIKDSLITLFNTTNLEHDILAMSAPHLHSEALTSVLNYGIPPLAGCYTSDLRWQEVERILRQAILRFEPRIIPDSLSIVPPHAGGDHSTGNTLRFAIHAMIHMEPYPLPFSLMSDVDLETNSVEASLVKV